MATRKKATAKTRAKRKKVSAKASTRKKTSAARKNRTITKKSAKKVARRQASPKKATPIRKAAVTSKPLSQRARPETTRSISSRPAQSTSAEQRIGIVTHFYSHLLVATARLDAGCKLRLGDVIHVRGHTTDFSQKVESLEVNHAPTTEVGPNDEFGLKVVEHAREHDVVFKVPS
jgi:hypothetical protein